MRRSDKAARHQPPRELDDKTVGPQEVARRQKPTDDAPSYALLAGGARYYQHLVAMLAEDGELIGIVTWLGAGHG